jgi:hypothetical protein
MHVKDPQKCHSSYSLFYFFWGGEKCIGLPNFGQKGRYYLGGGDLNVLESIILKWALQNMKVLTGFIWPKIENNGRCGRVLYPPISYSGGPEFKSWSGDRQS